MRVDRGEWGDDADEAPAEPLTAAQAQALRAKLPSDSPWQLMGIQALAGLVVAALCWGATARVEVAWSALYGAAAAIVPAMVMLWGVGPLSGTGAAVSIVRFMAWEGVKLVLAVAMLLLASRVLPQLSWPALLVALVVCIKVNWLAPLWRSR
ncbi:MAG: ATP synthase subunit I [Burkholderiaceae bacterium]|nr:ATP synthase subunit I [Burkholderiaceae bacterium]MDH3459856.1 ATP synthase subunit I [Burkholderiaceae bacterium]